jgi:hypothetical protein
MQNTFANDCAVIRNIKIGPNINGFIGLNSLILQDRANSFVLVCHCVYYFNQRPILIGLNVHNLNKFIEEHTHNSNKHHRIVGPNGSFFYPM